MDINFSIWTNLYFYVRKFEFICVTYIVYVEKNYIDEFLFLTILNLNVYEFKYLCVRIDLSQHKLVKVHSICNI